MLFVAKKTTQRTNIENRNHNKNYNNSYFTLARLRVIGLACLKYSEDWIWIVIFKQHNQIAMILKSEIPQLQLS